MAAPCCTGSSACLLARRLKKSLWAPWLAVLGSVAGLFSLFGTLAIGRAPIDLWAAFLVSPLFVFTMFTTGLANTFRWWRGDTLSLEETQHGLARNRGWEKPTRAIAQHTVLLHATAATLIPILWILTLQYRRAMHWVAPWEMHLRLSILRCSLTIPSSGLDA